MKQIAKKNFETAQPGAFAGQPTRFARRLPVRPVLVARHKLRRDLLKS
jgi:hypothetical protein